RGGLHRVSLEAVLPRGPAGDAHAVPAGGVSATRSIRVSAGNKEGEDSGPGSVIAPHPCRDRRLSFSKSAAASVRCREFGVNRPACGARPTAFGLGASA